MSEHRHPHCHKGELKDLTRQLREKAHKITGPREAVLDVLRQHPHPMTNKEIHARLPEGLCDLATVYRSMHMLQKMDMVTRFDFGDGVARFELNAPGDDGHHHHLICTECSCVVEIDECFQKELEQSLARQHGFKGVTHKLEFFGICPRCQEEGK